MKKILLLAGLVLASSQVFGQWRSSKLLYKDGPTLTIPFVQTTIDPATGNCGLDTYVYYLFENTVGQSNAMVRRTDNNNAPDFAQFRTWNGSGMIAPPGCTQGGGVGLYVITGQAGSVTFTEREWYDAGTQSGVDEWGNPQCGYDCTASGSSSTFTFTYTVVDYNWTNTGGISEMCLNESAISLSDYMTYTSGVSYSGPGVSNGVFTPSSAGVGTHNIVATRTFDNGSVGRTLQITVRELPNVAFDIPSGVCNDATSYSLPSYVTNWSTYGGSFSGNGVSGSFFIPNSSGSTGNKTLTYVSGVNSYGCNITLTDVVNVVADFTASAGSAQSACQGESITLTGGSPSGGSWSTSSCAGCLSGNTFNASGLAAGAYTVTYTYNSSGCIRSANKTVSVNALPSVEAGGNLSSCANGSSVDLTLGGVSPSGGVWSSPNSTVNTRINNGAGTLNPVGIPAGTYTLTYTVTTSCSNSDTRSITILAPPTVDAGTNQTVCLNGGNVALSGGTPSGGTWSGTGVTGSTFSPTTAGTGTHTITYSYSDGTCSNTDTKTITVNTAGTIDAGVNLEACVNTGNLSLTDGSPSGGTWSGTAVTGTYFDTSVGAGTYTVTYTAVSNGCSGSDTRTVTINPRPTVEAGINLTSCTNSADFTLSGNSPSGGTWSGTGINGNFFSPSTAGAGTHTLTYTYTNSNGCTSSDTRTVTVGSPTPVSIGSDKTFCSNSGAYNLNADLPVGYTGGTWSGSGVSGVNFNPSNVTPGTYVITYTYTNANGCVSTQTKQFTVVTGPSVDAGSVMEVCINEGLINLVGESPTGGTWSGFGVTGNQFNPSTTGTGAFTITYSYTTSTCTVTDTRQIVVNDISAIDAGNNLSVCSNAADFLLTGASTNGGVWNGTGVAGGFFSPSSAGVGTHTITYSYTNNKGCISSDTRSITVNSAPTVNAGADITVCSNASIYSLIADVNVTGGSFTGPGVQILNFNPAVAGVGVHQINYTYTNPSTGCSATDFRYITVIAPQSVSIGANQSVCVDATPFALTGASVAGGSYSGNGVSAGVLSPAVAGVGTHTITYTVVDGNGCNATGTKTISVIALPTVEAGPDIFVCSGSPLVSLSGTGQPIGGTFSGTHVSGGNFNVGSSGPGTFQVTYTYTNANGCTNTDTKNIIVDAGATVNAGPDFSVCVGDPLVDLASRVSPGGGSFVGTGINGTNFNTSVGPGSYTITYSLTNSYGCSGTDSFVITVNALPVVNAGSAKTLCFNEPSYDLSLTAIPAGGAFSGPGVTGNFFNPSSAGVGVHTVYYTYTNASGCTTTASRTLTVTDLPTVNAGSNLFLCVNGNLQDLNVGATPVNGSWTGPGVVNGIFNPALAGVGVHVTRYTITQSNGCSNYDEKVITVFNQLAVDAGPDITVCSNGSTINLSSGASVTGGTWSGTGVTGSSFNPGVGSGTYQMTLNYTDFYGCSAIDTKTITVIIPASVSVGSDLSVCVTGSPIALNTSVFPTGGTFTGTGVSGSTFTPSLAGIGVHPISYTVTDGQNCTTTKTRTITVTAPPTVDAGPNKVVCISGGIIDLDAGASVTGGTWSGTAINGSFLDPTTSGVGTFVVNYSYDNGQGCVSTDTKTITVRNDATVEVGADLTFCENSAPFDLSTQPNKPGGTWTGVGLTGSIFASNTAGPGTHVLIYKYTDTFGCSATDTKTINVNSKPAVSAGSPVSLCTTASALNLSSAVFPSGGSWIGAGITGNFFNPQSVGTGVYSLTYKVTDANGCSNTSVKQITVALPSTIDTGPNKTVCISSGLLDLDQTSGVSGGVWSGQGVSNNQFDPSFTGTGNFLLTYTYNDGQGCISTDTKTIIVKNNPIVNAGPDLSVCLNTTPINLTTQVSIPGGVWSGTGISSSTFTPSTAGLGVHVLRYTYTDPNLCSVSDYVTISVNDLPNVDAGPPLSTCTTAGLINLDQSAFPLGGSWSGAGVTGSNFNPAVVSLGQYDLVYSYTSAQGCTVSDIKKVTVTQPDVVTVGTNMTLCENSVRVDITLGVSKLGGIWSGTGVEGTFFNPALAGTGTHVLTYTYNNGQGCISTATRTFQVRTNLTVDAGLDVTTCVNSLTINLDQAPSISGGVWTGTGITNGNFIPSSAGVGVHLLTYKVTDEFGCKAQDTKNVIVNSITPVDAGPPASICTTATPLNLSNAVSLPGGVWSGPGISGNSFDPSITGVGTFDVTYTYTNANSCQTSDIRKITVSIPENITIGANQILCVNSASIDLDLNVSKVGGAWIGPGLEGNFFNPTLAGTGTHTITYSYNNGQGCIATASKSIQVRPAITVNAGPDVAVCVNDQAYNLSLAVDKLGGTFSGSGVTGSNFNPAAAGVGTHVITYNYNDAIGCAATDTRSITVNGTTFIDAGPDATLCTTASALDLTPAVSIAGGTWSGSGISGNTFNPALTGVGTFNVVYSYTNGSGCTTTDTRKITVNLPESVSIGANKILCLNSQSIDLDLNVSKVGGTWSGSAALEGNFFNPSLVTSGNHTVTYSYDNGQGCISTASKIIQVRPSITVNAGIDFSRCVNGTPYNLATDVDKSGGVFSGAGISGNNFNPSTAGTGNHIITYTYQDGIGCVATDVRTISVTDITEVDAGPDASICSTAPVLNLSASVSLPGGVWSGSGVTGSNFNPANVGVGSYNLLYSFTNASGCISTDIRKVTVSLPPSVTIGPNKILCVNSPRIDLDLSVSKVGGTWSGSTGLEGSFFNPSLAGIGTHTVTYSYNDGSGCISTASKTMQVRAAITVSAGSDKTFCYNSGSYSLTNDSDILGGTWSGLGVIGTNFVPATAGVGTHIITYTYNDEFGCSASDTRLFTVNSQLDVNAGPDIKTCNDSGSISLATSGFPSGGVWSGQGLTGDQFFPAVVGSGVYNLTYTYTDGGGCFAADSKQIIVTNPPVVEAGANFEICINAAPITLTGATPSGGAWSGTGIIAGVFDPLSAGLGEHTLTYSYTNSDACAKSDAITVKVLAEPTLTVGSDISVCKNDFPINLLTDASIKGGTFSGTGITGTVFNPDEAGKGTHVITYRVRFNGCDLLAFRNITVNVPEILSIGENLTVCVETIPFDLIKDVNIVGGTFTGTGMDGTTFRPVNAGIGSHVITYTYVNSFGCTSTAFRVITVEDQLPISAGDDITLCNSVGNYNLTGRGTPDNGVFVGTGVVNNIFDPAITGLGTFTIQYVVNNGNGCVSTDEFNIIVKPSTITDFGKDSILCINASPMQMNFNSELSGGTWSGNGVVANVFYPSLAGVGTHTLNYKISTLACDIAGRRIITVTALPLPATTEMTTTSGCIGSFITLTAKINPDDRVNNVTVGWFRKNDTEPFATGESILFQIAGDEHIYFRSINQFGCSSGQSDFIRIQTDNPTGDFYTQDLTIPFAKPIIFYSTNLKNAEKFEWSFGDGLISYEKNPYKYYYESGSFDVSLKLTSSTGCVTTITKEDYITVLVEPGREDVEPENPGGRVGPDQGTISHSPNPHDGRFSIEVESPDSGPYQILVSDFIGHTNNLGIVELVEGYNKIDVDISSQPSGMYTVIVRGNKYIYNFKTIKK
jgi:hypothetical protein